MRLDNRFLVLASCWLLISIILLNAVSAQDFPFGDKFPKLDSRATGEWWKKKPGKRKPLDLNVPRDQVVAFAVYTHDRGQLRLTGQLFPLMPDESRQLELFTRQKDGDWVAVGTEQVVVPGWSAHFTVPDWDNRADVHYQVRHGESVFEGTIRKDPVDKETIVVGNLSCNSSRTPGARSQIVENLKRLDPDLLFFAGDQSYHHTEHTYGWLEFGMQFRDVLKDRPVVTIPDDHDVGQANIWGENGKRATNTQGPSGGYFYPPSYVNMVQRCQTWHLPVAVDPAPVKRGIGVYFTSLRIGGVDFAIIEDRKFKSGPEGKIPKMGPRPDHINDPSYDAATIDLPGLKLLGERQLQFLDRWAEDWTNTEMKCVLSQTAFCGAVHLHGTEDNRLIADLDCNGWPQTGRNKALRAIRRARATHLCGDQHLSVVVKHGIDEHGDGPYAFTSPAIVNTIYGRWWQPEDKQPGPNPRTGSPLPWTGDYLDGMGNRISMLAYANPADRKDEQQRGDGFGIARFNKRDRSVTFEAWPRFADVAEGDQAQYSGWPVTIKQRDNDGRKPVGWLKTIVSDKDRKPVVQVIDEANDRIIYTVRADSHQFRPPVYSSGKHTIKVGFDKPDLVEFAGQLPEPEGSQQTIVLPAQPSK